MKLIHTGSLGKFLCTLVTAACTSHTPSPTVDTPPDVSAPAAEAEATPLQGDLPPELRALQKDGLEIKGDRVIFAGDKDLPPKLKGEFAESAVQIKVAPGPHPSVLDARKSMRAAAVADPRVKAALGERFALLNSGWLEPAKDAATSAAQDQYQMVFYNYARNDVVTVVASGTDKVLNVSSDPVRVQPAESREEVDAAIAIVRADPEYGKLISKLQGRGIQTEGPGNNRYLYLLFYRKPGTPAIVDATVDMSSGKVTAARSLGNGG